MTWKQIGSLILAISVAVSGSITQLPITENQKIWAMFFTNLIGVVATFFVNTLEEKK